MVNVWTTFWLWDLETLSNIQILKVCLYRIPSWSPFPVCRRYILKQLACSPAPSGQLGPCRDVSCVISERIPGQALMCILCVFVGSSRSLLFRPKGVWSIRRTELQASGPSIHVYGCFWILSSLDLFVAILMLLLPPFAYAVQYI